MSLSGSGKCPQEREDCMIKKLSFIIMVSLALAVSNCAAENPEIRFGFEKGLDGWDIPEWALERPDYVGQSIEISPEHATKGENSLKLNCDFPGTAWRAVVVEHVEDINLRGYKRILVDVFIPSDAPSEFLRGKIIVTAGPWWYIEMLDSVPLKRGDWTTITARLDVGDKGEMRYWKCKTKEECLEAHLDQVKKLAVRIEYNASYDRTGRAYKGPVYIDNIIVQ